MTHFANCSKNCTTDHRQQSIRTKMQRQFAIDDEHQPIAISLPEDSMVSIQTSSGMLGDNYSSKNCLRPEGSGGHKGGGGDWCEDNAFCIYPLVQIIIGLVDLGAFYMQWKIVKVNAEQKPAPLATFPGEKVALFSFLLSLIFQEAFLWLERDSRRTAVFATLSFIGSICVMCLVWFYQKQYGEEYGLKNDAEAMVRVLFLFFLWLLFLIVAIIYVVRLTRLAYHISQRQRVYRE